MALCTSCGNQIEESASFCTSCGKPMPAATHPSAAVTVMRPVCPACGAQADPGAGFCTECGKRLNAQAEPVAEAAPAVAALPISPAVEAVPASPSPVVFCTNCGSKLESRTGFCTNCGQPVTAASNSSSIISEPEMAAPATSSTEATPRKTAQPLAPPVVAEPTLVTTPPEPSVVAAPPIPVEATRAAGAAESSINYGPVEPAPQIAAPVYATPSDYPPAQPGRGAFRVIVLVLLLLIVIGGLGGWYFMGVETVIVCSPPDVTVFLDDKELAPTSYGRYVVPHLSRQQHLLRVQRPGFADTIERLNFPLTSLHEWVNIKLVPRRLTRSSSPR
jgi:rRNA maturation endonuclease Nob1